MDGQRGLFPAAPYMSDESRYPRGYNPHRMREVRDALDKGGLNGAHGTSLGTWMTNGEIWADPRRGRGHRFEQDQIRQTIARSTVPTSDLRHLDSIQTGGSAPGVSGYYVGDEEGFDYPHAKEPAARVYVNGTVKGRTGDEMRAAVEGLHPGQWSPSIYAGPNEVSRTLIHELGHHAQNAPHLDKGGFIPVNGNEYATDSVAQTDPALEADAMNYEEKHFRNDRRFTPATEMSAYDTVLKKHLAGEDMPMERSEWAEDYRHVRNLSASQFDHPYGQTRSPHRQGELW